MTTKNVAAVDIPVTPGDTKSLQAESQLVGVRRKSITSISGVQINKPKPIPNYLRPSRGSCHDHCKYGPRRDNSQTQAEIPRRSAKATQSENLGRQHKTAKITVELETKTAEKKVHMRTKLAASSPKPTSRLSRTQTLESTNKRNLKLKPSNPETTLEEVPNDKKTTESDIVPEKTLYMVEAEDEKRSNDKKINSTRTKRVPQESNGCTVLKFRQLKTLGQTKNENPKYGKKSLRKVVSDGSSISTDGNMYTSSSSHHVVLRPHAIEKEDTCPRLYNRVIKETASKLVRTRKSRVKALVGAFETVINLQENKTSRTITKL